MFGIINHTSCSSPYEGGQLPDEIQGHISLFKWATRLTIRRVLDLNPENVNAHGRKGIGL